MRDSLFDVGAKSSSCHMLNLVVYSRKDVLMRFIWLRSAPQGYRKNDWCRYSWESYSFDRTLLALLSHRYSSENGSLLSIWSMILLNALDGPKVSEINDERSLVKVLMQWAEVTDWRLFLILIERGERVGDWRSESSVAAGDRILYVPVGETEDWKEPCWARWCCTSLSEDTLCSLQKIIDTRCARIQFDGNASSIRMHMETTSVVLKSSSGITPFCRRRQNSIIAAMISSRPTVIRLNDRWPCSRRTKVHRIYCWIVRLRLASCLRENLELNWDGV